MKCPNGNPFFSGFLVGRCTGGRRNMTTQTLEEEHDMWNQVLHHFSCESTRLAAYYLKIKINLLWIVGHEVSSFVTCIWCLYPFLKIVKIQLSSLTSKICRTSSHWLCSDLEILNQIKQSGAWRTGLTCCYEFSILENLSKVLQNIFP